MKNERNTLKDIARESYRIVKDSKAYSNLSSLANKALMPLMMPSYFRIEKENIKNEKISSFLKPDQPGPECLFSMIPVAASTLGFLFAGTTAMQNGYSEALLLPLATNLASAGYEIARKAKKNLDERCRGMK